MKILHFEGEGHGFMSGVKEYVIVCEDDDENEKRETAPGFELVSSTILDTDLPSSFPTETTLVPCR